MPHILIAEDTADIRELLRRILLKAGHTVREATNGQQALALAQKEPFDLLITDLFMPGMDGLEVIQHFRKAFPSTPIVAVSGGGYNGLLDVLSLAQLLGAREILNKPFTRKAVLDVVNEAIGLACAC